MFEVVLKPFYIFVNWVNGLNEHYTVLTYDEVKALTIMQRFKLYNWTFELYCSLIIFFIFIGYKIGVSINLKKADSVFDSIHVFLKDDLKLAKVGLTTMKNGTAKLYLDQHLHTWFVSFATGRSSIASIQTKLHLKARNNLIGLFFKYFFRYFFNQLNFKELDEFVEIVIKPNGVFVSNENSNVNNNSKEILNNFKFISSIVNKNVMAKARNDNYFLSLTHVHENPILPNQYVFMSEINQLNEFFYNYINNKKSFNNILDNAKNLLNFISFTDLPTEKPESAMEFNKKNEPMVIVNCNVPTSNEELVTLNKLIESCVEVIDGFTMDLVQKKDQLIVKPEMLKKINNFRQEEIKKIELFAKELELERINEEKKELEKEKRRELRKTGQLQANEQKMKEKRERRSRNKQRTRNQ